MKKIFIFLLLSFALSNLVQSQILVNVTLPDNCSEDTPTKINNTETSQNNSINVYPNPNEGSFTLNVNFTKKIGTATIEIYEVSGKQVYKEDIFCNSELLIRRLDLPKFPAGVYVLSIRNSSQIITTNCIIK